MRSWSERCGRRWLYSSTNWSQQLLEFVDRGRGGVGGEPAFEGLVEAFDFAAGRRMVRSLVLLDDGEAVEEVFEPVAAALAAGQSGGEHHPVIGQRGGRDAVCFQGVGERVDDDGAGDPRWAVTEMA